MKKKIFLNLGCGKDIKKSTVDIEWINVDRIHFSGVDKVFDLNKYPYPFNDNSVDFVHCHGVLEYLDDVVAALAEIYRILKKNGFAEILVPYCGHAMAFIDPSNKHYFSYNSFISFGRVKNKFPRQYHEINFVFSEMKPRLIFGKKYAVWNYLLEPLFNRMPSVYEGTPLRMFPAQYLVVSMKK